LKRINDKSWVKN